MNLRKTILFTATSMYALATIGVAAFGTYGTSVAAAQSDTEWTPSAQNDAGDTADGGNDTNPLVCT